MPKKSDKDSCMSFEQGWIAEAEDCQDCKKTSPKRYDKCLKAVKRSLKENFSTDEEIEKWKKERVKNGNF